MSAPGPDGRAKATHDDDDDFAPPSSAQVNPSKRVIKSHPPTLVTTTAPARRIFFDPWNSSSTGHQRAENRLSGSTSWRTSRSLKLGQQYKGGLTGGGNRVADTVGAGSEDFGKDGRKENGDWERGARGLRTDGQRSLAEVWSISKAGKTSLPEKEVLREEHASESLQGTTTDVYDISLESTLAPQVKQIFQAHGAQHAIALGRRTVTHVILGTVGANGGCGGGLAATKLQKEVVRTGGKAVRYITVNWVLDSIQAGRRLPESRFAPLKLAPKSQGGVFGMFNRSNAMAHGNGKAK
ncbi:hypothetical protein OPT61_g2767 [Boeremia exigua]|uniref:Uncharacterized protein n=1 Tax=Boeremia exigua TaxID=749465 RepID=A0ACC2IKL4_9PLEO|nr:hypothetical protein OPT61_g2767 [Boeremia exigua]